MLVCIPVYQIIKHVLNLVLKLALSTGLIAEMGIYLILRINKFDSLMPGYFLNSFSPCSFSDLPPDINRFEITLSNKTKKSKDPDICKFMQKLCSKVKKKKGCFIYFKIHNEVFSKMKI